MSMEAQQINWLLDMQADLDMALAEQDWEEANNIIQEVGDAGYEYEYEALIMHQSRNRAIAHAENEKEDLARGKYNPDDYRPEYPRE